MTKEKLDPVTTTLVDIQSRVLAILTPQTILIGHSLNADLTSLKLTHPRIVDTTLIYPHPRGPPLKQSLRWLTQRYLSREIQKHHGSAGHDSIEDAVACLDLVKQKCEKGPSWGTSEASSEPIFKRLAREGKAFSSEADGGETGGDGEAKMTGKDDDEQTSDKQPARTERRGKSAVVDWGEPRKGLGASADILIGCQNDDEVVDGVKSVLWSEDSTREIKDEDVDMSSNEDVDDGEHRKVSSDVTFVWARLRELEAFRGWWNKNRSGNAAGGGMERSSPSPPPPSHNTTTTTTIITDIKTASLPTSHQSTTSPSQAPSHSSDDKDTKQDSDKASSTIPSSSPSLAKAVAQTTARIAAIHAALPPRTAFMVYSGSGDPRETARLQAQQQAFRREYAAKKWDELSVKWTDAKEQSLKEACRRARMGIGFVGVVG